MERASGRILVVEDNDLVRDHVSGQLTGLGYTVSAVRNGPAALELLAADAAFDLLFTDIMMPGGMNGRELAERVRERHPHLPILFTTGFVDDPQLASGEVARLVLRKPYGYHELASRVAAAIRGEHTPEP